MNTPVSSFRLPEETRKTLEKLKKKLKMSSLTDVVVKAINDAAK